MADSDMILAYIGKMLSQLGSTLGGNQQNLVNYGQQAAASNENLLADLHQKKYEEEKKKQEDKGLFGDLLNLGGTAASVAFPAAAPVILPATAAASGAVTGGVEGALAGGAKAALPQIANIPVSGGDGASAGRVDVPNQPLYTQDFRVGEDTRPGGAASAQPANLGPDGMPKANTLESTYVNPAPESTGKSGGLFNTIFSDPRIQEQITGIADRLSTPSKPHLSTVGLYPETASNLRQQVSQQENADRSFQFEQQQAAEKNKYYETQNQLDRERLDIEKQKANRTTAVKPIDSGVVSLPDGSYARQLINPENNQVVNIPLGGSGEDAAIPISLLPKSGADTGSKLVNVGGAVLPQQDLSAQAQELISQGYTPVEAYTSIAAKIREQMPVSQVPIVVDTNQGKRVVNRSELPVDAVIPGTNPAESPSEQRLKQSADEDAKSKEDSRVTNLSKNISSKVDNAATGRTAKKAVPVVTSEIQDVVYSFEQESGKRVQDVTVSSVSFDPDTGEYTAKYKVKVEGEGLSNERVIRGTLNAE